MILALLGLPKDNPFSFSVKIIVFCVILNLLMSVLKLVREQINHSKLKALLTRVEDSERESMAVLQIVKEWVQQAKTHRDDAKESLGRMEDKADKATVIVEVVAEKMEEVKAAVIEKVESIVKPDPGPQSGDSQYHP